MKRLLSMIMLGALIAVTAHAGPLAIDGGRISSLSSIEGIGTLEINLKIRIVPDSESGARVVVIDGEDTSYTELKPSSATKRGEGNHSPVDGVRNGFAVARALRCAAKALAHSLLSYIAGN